MSLTALCGPQEGSQRESMDSRVTFKDGMHDAFGENSWCLYAANCFFGKCNLWPMVLHFLMRNTLLKRHAAIDFPHADSNAHTLQNPS